MKKTVTEPHLPESSSFLHRPLSHFLILHTGLIWSGGSIFSDESGSKALQKWRLTAVMQGKFCGRREAKLLSNTSSSHNSIPFHVHVQKQCQCHLLYCNTLPSQFGGQKPKCCIHLKHFVELKALIGLKTDHSEVWVNAFPLLCLTKSVTLSLPSGQQVSYQDSNTVHSVTWLWYSAHVWQSTFGSFHSDLFNAVRTFLRPRLALRISISFCTCEIDGDTYDINRSPHVALNLALTKHDMSDTNDLLPPANDKSASDVTDVSATFIL